MAAVSEQLRQAAEQQRQAAERRKAESAAS
jgi:hypothetical protein